MVIQKMSELGLSESGMEDNYDNNEPLDAFSDQPLYANVTDEDSQNANLVDEDFHDNNQNNSMPVRS